MKSPRNRRILLSGYVIFRESWPFGFLEVVADVLGPIVNRIVFMVMLLANFKYFGRNASSSMNFFEMLDMAQPIFLSVVAVLTLPGVVAFLSLISKRNRNSRLTDRVIKKICYILYGSTQFNEEWKEVYEGQKIVLEYVIFICMVAPVFLYFSWPIFVALFMVANLFVATGIYTFSIEKNRLATKIIEHSFYVTFLRNLFFCIYLLICTAIIWKTEGQFPIEFIFVLIVGMRMLTRKANNIIVIYRSGVFDRPAAKVE